MNPNKFLTNGKTKLVNGSIINPELGSLRLVFLPCSESGVPDSALHNILDRKWKQAKVDLKGWKASNINYKLGNINTTAVQSDTWIIHGLCYNKEGVLDEKALDECVKKMANLAKSEKASVHVSMITMGAIEKLGDSLLKRCVENGISVYFYES